MYFNTYNLTPLLFLFNIKMKSLENTIGFTTTVAKDKLSKYKGIFYDNDTTGYQDSKTGAHFDYSDMCRRLQKISDTRRKIDNWPEIDEEAQNEVPDEQTNFPSLALYNSRAPKKLISSLQINPYHFSYIHTMTEVSEQNQESPHRKKQYKDKSLYTISAIKIAQKINPKAEILQKMKEFRGDSKQDTISTKKIVLLKHSGLYDSSSTQLTLNAPSDSNLTFGSVNGPSPHRVEHLAKSIIQSKS